MNLSRPLKIIGIYRPPYSEANPVSANVFFDEFSAYLENIVMCPEVLLISGDFNFHLDSHIHSDADNSRIYWKRLVSYNMLLPLRIHLVIS